MKALSLLAFLALPGVAVAQDLTDDYGRAVTCNGAGPVTCTVEGVTIEAATKEAALSTANGMAPAGYTPPAPIAPSLSPSAALIAQGVTITSTSTPALNGIYALDPATQAAVNAVSTFVLVNPGSFPGGASQVFLDMAGNPHIFTSTAQWQAFASAMARLVASIDLYAAGQGAAPALSVTIP